MVLNTVYQVHPLENRYFYDSESLRRNLAPQIICNALRFNFQHELQQHNMLNRNKRTNKGSSPTTGVHNFHLVTATRLYNPLGGAYYHSCGCFLLSRDSRGSRPSGVQYLATGVYNFLCTITAGLYRGVLFK